MLIYKWWKIVWNFYENFLRVEDMIEKSNKLQILYLLINYFKNNLFRISDIYYNYHLGRIYWIKIYIYCIVVALKLHMKTNNCLDEFDIQNFAIYCLINDNSEYVR